MFRPFILLCLVAFAAVVAEAQADVQKVVDAEHAFAAMAAEKGTPPAFLAYMTADAVAFVPDQISAKEYYGARNVTSSLLSWAPNYADISSNGLMGYTTGNWEFRATGKNDTPSAFGDFVTVWIRQPDGNYKWVMDIGVGHPKPTAYSTEWTTTRDKERDPNTQNSSAADTANGFQIMVKAPGEKAAYQAYADDELRLYREGEMPFLGKKAGLKRIGDGKGQLTLAKKSTFFGSGDLAYTNGKYTRVDGGSVIEKGNYMQIWKLKKGKWKIVLDVFKPVPESAK